MNLVIQDGYCRNYSREYGALADAMKRFYPLSGDNSETGSLICPSGMSAISVCLNALFRNDFTIVRTGELYCDTPRLLDSFTKSRIFDSSSQKRNELFSGKKVILFIESASNPSGDIFDFKILPSLRRLARQLIVIVDNTWLSHVILNPMKYNVDITINSLTKYYSAGTCIAGSIVCRQQYFKAIKSYMNLHGIHTSPHNCQLVLDNLGNIDERIIRSSAIIEEVAAVLATAPDFIDVRHVSIPHSSGKNYAEEYYNVIPNGSSKIIYPSVLTFKLAMSKNKAIEWMKSTGLRYETSFGSAHSKFDTWPVKCGDYTQCRLSVGYDDTAEAILAALKV
jgi:cystathionine beta-lyase/cystathionine gamma-synthase